MIRLYDHVLSASAYKVRLMAALLGVKMQLEAVDFHPGRAHKSVAFRALNPAGTLPVLVDGDLVLTESTAMLVYLAGLAGPDFLASNASGPNSAGADTADADTAGQDAVGSTSAGPNWLGTDAPRSQALVQQWLAFSGRLAASLGMARLHDMLLYPGDIAALRHEGHCALRELEAALTERRFAGQGWLTGDTPTIADIACFPNVALSQDGGVSLDVYPAVRLWSHRIRSLEHFVEMPGIHRLHELRPAPVAR